MATNDVHFISRDDHDAHDVLICIGEKCLKLDDNRKHYPTEVYFKSAEEMAAVFPEYPEALANTLEIAEKCNVTLTLDPTSSEKYPQFDSPDGSPREEYFAKVCYDGLERLYGEKEKLRLEDIYEKSRPNLTKCFSSVCSMRSTPSPTRVRLLLPDHSRLYQWGREQDIPVGPGRGSAAGSLVAYTMGITNICPMLCLFRALFEPRACLPSRL